MDNTLGPNKWSMLPMGGKLDRARKRGTDSEIEHEAGL